MVLVTTLVGFYLGADGAPSLRLMLHTLLGTALAAAGTLALNQYIERDLDARMERTRHRPLPDGRLAPDRGARARARAPGCRARPISPPPPACACALVTAAIAVTYLLAYTPLKTRHVAVLARRRRARRAAAGGRLGRGTRRRRAGGLGAVRDHVPLADSAHARDRPAVPGRLRPRRHPRAAVVDRDGSARRSRR